MELVRRRKLGAASDAAGEDGDFVQLRLVRERRLKEKQETGLPADGFSEVTGAILKEKANTFRDGPKSRPSTAARIRATEELREELFQAVDTSDKHQIQLLLQKICQFGKVSEIRDPVTDENVLHYALSRDQKNIAIFLISLQDLDLMMSHHVVHKSGIHGRNNALHIITEKHDTEMAKFLLAKLPSTEKRLEIMEMKTAVNNQGHQGQRPRLFSCLHLAAYYGHTDLVTLYLDQGMDVNHLNGKKDTALLWAARWGHDNTVSLLLDREADPEVKNDKGSTALYWAIRYEFPKTVRLLLKKGKANPNTTRQLGLVAPIVIAAAYGNVEIMSLLLQHPDIDMNVKIRGGEMPTHHAAKEGCLSIIEMLIKRGALFDEQDEKGDTPLLLAAKSGHVDIVQELIRQGANVTHRNHEGHDAWYFAMENEDNALLQTLVTATRDHEMSWRQPLCIAASSGRCDKIQFLLKMNIDPLKADADGNTFLHHAAMSNQSEVMEKFHETISINTQNNRGNTPLHIACFRGNTKTIESLIKCKAKADVKNKKGETALHVAAYSKHITADTVRMLVEYTIKTHAWESLNAKDFGGNNCLHIAGKFAKPEVLWEFRLVRFKDRDKDGLTPLHEAVRPDQPEALEMMLDIFESMQRDARINEQSYATSETVLHLAADEGHANAVKRLISLGADIAMKDINGDTVLHRLTKQCADDSRNVSRHLEVFDTILENVVKWWCIRKNIPFPEEENQDVFMSHRREAILFLINDICNNEGLSVVDQAFKSGVPEVLSKLLMLEGVTMFVQSDKFVFDITSLTPRSNDSMQVCCGNRRVSPVTEKDEASKSSAFYLEGISGIEWLISHTEKARAAEILDLPPIRIIEQYYRSMVAWTFVSLMIFHIVYMAIFTYVGVELLKKLRNDESSINSSDSDTLLMYIIVPIEPAIILLYVLYTLFRYCITDDLGRKSRLSRKKGLRQVASIIASYLFLAVCVVFAVLVFAWIGLFTERYAYQDYFLSAALCIGWLLTISFTRGIRAIHYFYRMLISMIFRDVFRFILVYLFVLLAFGFAFHVLFQISSAISSDYPNPADTLFLTFNMMIGMGELFDDAFETNMSDAGRTTVYSKVLYVIFIILATIVLLNLLIAMMNDSYSMILQENQITWRIESVSLGVDIESNFLASKVFSRGEITRGELGQIVSSVGLPSERWYVSMREDLYDQYMRESDRKYSKSTDAVSKRLEDIDTRVAEVERQTNENFQHLSKLLEQIRDRYFDFFPWLILINRQAMELARRRKLGAASDAAGEDGDFVQLRLVRERRQKERQETGLPAEGFSDVTGAILKEKAKNFRDEPKSRPSTAARIRAAEDFREELFKAVDTSDKHQIQLLLQKIGQFGKVSEIRDPVTDENVLHYALSRDQKDIATFLISLQDLDLLLSHHDVQRSGIHGRNNALHIITEKHDTEMAKFLLAKLPSKEKRLEIMKLETAVDIQGQRPRLFSCLHLAAYYGHTDLVTLYLDQGMDVNHLNGKKDTALLWAARWGHDNTVNLLLDRKADPEVKNDKGSTALYWAIRYEFPKTVSLLLKKGNANPNTSRKLGLVAPIVIAAAYGNVEIMSLLLQHPDIDMNVKIRGGEMPVHHAAREGCPSIIEMLIKRGALFDEQDEIGDTPLLLAAKSGHVDIVQELIRQGANVTHRNHEGHDAWYFAMENEDNALLQTLVTATRDHEMSWRQPLCIAASSGRCDKIQFLLKMNIDPLKADADGNTFLHHAAMSNQSEVMEKFHETISINTQNNRGNTPLHIACFRGNTKTIESLIKCKAKADVKNKKGETALHVAAYSKHITSDTVRKLVEYTIKTHAWESLNAKDFEGNNCLHIAGKFAKPEVLWEFRFVRFKDRDKDGLIPLHEAVRPDQPEALEMMLDIFESMQRDARINEQSYATSETVLHLAADEGHANAVKRLISLGADIAMKDINGDTVLHRLTKQCANDSRNVSRHLEVFDTILENVVKWWCIRKNVPFPEEENQDVFMTHRREAILFLINDIYNNEGLSVVDQAFKSGVPEVLSKLLMLEGVTMFVQSDKFVYDFDITSLTPRSNDAVQGCCGSRRVSPLTEKDIASKSPAIELEGISGIEWLISHTEKARAAEILDLPPIRIIEQYYRSMVAWTFVSLMIFHIIYMAIFTYVGVELLQKLRNDESSINSSDSDTLLMYVIVPVEPAIILLYVLYTLFRYCITGDLGRKSRLSRKKGLSQVVSIIASYMFLAVCVVFAVLVFAWIGLFTERYEFQDYFLSAALCIGWLLTISFTRGIRAIHYFYRMLISMIFRDVSRFILVYLFVLLAFGFAFHVLFQISGAISSDYPSPADTLFLTFNMMIGMGELFDDAFETNMSDAGRTTVYSKVLYLIYIILATIVLLNLLIAMMNDSYSMILKENQITWRIESVSLGVDIESNFPASKVFSRVKITRGELGQTVSSVPSERWYISMTEDSYNQFMRDSDRKYSKSTDAVTKRLEDIDTRVAEVERQTNDKLQHISELLEQIRDRK
ncbi:uncharacterized protein LOC123561014 [Mercenaria mercenaria]|uniref:uncharacterized protein LOC123561014 n=1 Tax=Mercenaria mercenaria TaxID=6596 RepID=UPI00234F1D88|nr:uncharacterized protein LOC123561014 [Mercenaria mercenaria]